MNYPAKSGVIYITEDPKKAKTLALPAQRLLQAEKKITLLYSSFCENKPDPLSL